MRHQILDSKGKPVKLNTREAFIANQLQHRHGAEMRNALGAEVDITTLTTITKRVVEQKFFTIAPALYMPIRVGEGAWSSELLTYRSYSLSGDFETGIINTGSNNSRLAEAGTGVDAISVPTVNWGKQISYSLFDIMQAQKSGNWDLVTALEKSRKQNWDLGIQKIAFVGAESNSNVKGLLTQSDVTANTALITKYISDMNEAEFQALLVGLMEAYRANAQRTAWPTHFIIPEADYNGLAVSVSEDFPLKSKLARLEESFKLITKNPNFQILPCAYADQSQNAAVSGLNKNRYTLLNYDEDSIRMDIPVDYTNTMQNTINGFQFQNVGYGQFTGAKAYRSREMLYLDFSEE